MYNQSRSYKLAEACLGTTVTVVIERPMGSLHPTYGFVYPLNYGFIPGTDSPDGEELDAYVLGVEQPLNEFTGDCIAIIHRTNDDDDKLVVVPKGMILTDETIASAVAFQEQFFESEVIRPE